MCCDIIAYLLYLLGQIAIECCGSVAAPVVAEVEGIHVGAGVGFLSEHSRVFDAVGIEAITETMPYQKGKLSRFDCRM